MIEMYEGPRITAQEPRNMYAGGQLVRNTVDGSRPGYDGDSKFNRNPSGINQYTDKMRTLEEIQKAIDDAPPKYVPKKDGTLKKVPVTSKDLYGKGKNYPHKIIARSEYNLHKDKLNIEGTGKPVVEDPKKANIVRYAKNKLQSNPIILAKMAGKGGFQLSHLSLTELDSLKNLGYLPKDINIKQYHSFEKKIVANAKEIYAVQNNKSLSLPEKRAEIAKLQKIDRALRKEFPKYANTKARLKVQANNLELSGLKIGEKLPDPTVAISQTEGTLLKDIKAGSQKEKEILGLSKKSLEAKIKELGGKNNVTKLLANGTANTEQKQILKEILRMGSGLMRGVGQMLSPKEFFKLKNLIGPGAWAAMGAFEAGIIGYETINNNTPLNEVLSDNWVTGWAMPWTKKEAQIKNLREANISGSPAMQKYMEQVKLMAEYERGEKSLNAMKNMDVPKEHITNQQAKLDEINNNWVNLQETAMVERDGEMVPVTGGELEFQKAVSDMEGERKAGKYDPSDLRNVNKYGYTDVGESAFKGLPLIGDWFKQGTPIKKDPQIVRTDLPPQLSTSGYHAMPKYDVDLTKYKKQPGVAEATTTPLDADQLQMHSEHLRNLGYLEPRGELPQWYIDMVQKNEKWRQLFEQSPTGLHGARFATGGLANLTRTVARDSGPMQGLASTPEYDTYRKEYKWQT